VVVLLLLLVALVGFGSASGTASLETGTRAIPATRVPKVTGLASASAVRRVRQAGLVPAQHRCRAAAIAWTVKSQRPAAGTTVPRGARVTLRLVPEDVNHTPCNAYSGPLP
jgi:beta-lactam-binding protein with PASTA domain